MQNNTKTTKQIYFGDNLEKFELYCEKTGRSLSKFAVRAMEEYMLRNPVK